MYTTKEEEVKLNDNDKNQCTMQHVRGGGKPLRMNQLLRSAFADASDPPIRDAALNHFSHCHPLLRLHLRETERIKCNFCDSIISGRGYACLRCDYYLHDVCCNFPKEIRHDFHPGYDHTLVLRPFRLGDDEEKFHCAACGVDDYELSLFRSYYCCRLCNFNLHVECASIPITLGLRVKCPLHLLFSLLINSESASLSCSICTEVVPISGSWLFYNHERDYLCHFDCAAIIEFATESDSMTKLQNRLKTLAITNRPPARASQTSEGVAHFTHRHTLREYDSGKPRRCSLCNFVSTMGFVCDGCNYFIGNTCFSLPSKIQHMSHPHYPLKLTWYADFQNGNLKCPGCQNYTNDSSARAYCCTECNFFIDHFCASTPKTLTVEDVSYKLSYSFPFKHEKAVIKCNRCSDKVVTKDSMLYYNLERDETLHVSCALIKESGIDSETRSNLSVQRLNELRIAD